MQAEGLLEPATQKDPAVHALQLLCPEAEYVPAEHCVLTPNLQNDPEGQSEQPANAPVPAIEYL